MRVDDWTISSFGRLTIAVCIAPGLFASGLPLYYVAVAFLIVVGNYWLNNDVRWMLNRKSWYRRLCAVTLTAMLVVGILHRIGLVPRIVPVLAVVALYFWGYSECKHGFEKMMTEQQPDVPSNPGS